MKITIKNYQLDSLLAAIHKTRFHEIRLNRFKNRFMKRLLDKEQDYQKELNDLRNTYIRTDEKGDFVVNENQLFVLKEENHKDEYIQAVAELDEEDVVIEFLEQETPFMELFLEMANASTEEPLSFVEASVLDNVLEQVESEEDSNV